MSDHIEDLLEEYDFLDEDGYLIPPQDPIVIETLERFSELRERVDNDPNSLDKEEKLELQDLHDLHSYYLAQLKAYEKEEFPNVMSTNDLKNFLLNAELADDDDDDDDYDDEEEEYDDDEEEDDEEYDDDDD